MSLETPSSSDLVGANALANSSLSNQSPGTPCKGCSQTALLQNCQRGLTGWDQGIGQYYARYDCHITGGSFYRYGDSWVFPGEWPAPHGF